jgi:hypothetical protein
MIFHYGSKAHLFPRIRHVLLVSVVLSFANKNGETFSIPTKRVFSIFFEKEIEKLKNIKKNT